MKLEREKKTRREEDAEKITKTSKNLLLYVISILILVS